MANIDISHVLCYNKVISQDDLIKMLESPGDNPADLLLEIMEDFLLGISK